MYSDLIVDGGGCRQSVHPGLDLPKSIVSGFFLTEVLANPLETDSSGRIILDVS